MTILNFIRYQSAREFLSMNEHTKSTLVIIILSSMDKKNLNYEEIKLQFIL